MSEITTQGYRSFQVNVAPGVYGGFTLLGAFAYFLAETWFSSIFAMLFISLLCFFDKPYLHILRRNKSKLTWFVIIVVCSVSSPPLFREFFNSPFSDFLAYMMPPIGGILTAIYVHFVYTEKSLQAMGWTNISQS